MNELLVNKKKSEVLAEKIKTLNYGDIVTHEQISEAIEESYSSNKYRSTVQKARKILEKDGIYLESIVGDGYRIVEPDNVVKHSLKHYKRGFNEMQKGYDTLVNAPVKNMSAEGKETYRRVYDRAVTLSASMKGAAVELKTLGKSKHPFAIENIRN